MFVLTAGVYRDLQELATKHGSEVLSSMKNNQFGDLPALSSLVSVSSQRVAKELFDRAYLSLNLFLFVFIYYLFLLFFFDWLRYKHLQQAVELSKEGKGSSKAFLKFGLFCDNALKQRKPSSKVFIHFH